jgi:hypothetical protein
MAELICEYGSSGAGKTAEILRLAKFVYKRTGKRLRLASCDGGGWKPLDGAIKAGLIEPWGVSAIENPRSVLRKLSQGFWPETVTRNGTLGLVLRAPSSKTWDDIGALAIEGLTSIANIIMRDALNRQLKVAGDDPQAQFTEKVYVAGLDGKELSQDEKYSFASRGNYNDSQRAVYDIVTNYRSLPVAYVYTSALETRGEEEDTRKTIVGPAVIGKAVTSQVGSWVGDLLHADDYFEDVPDPQHKLTPDQLKLGAKQRMMQVVKRRVWFMRHPDPATGLVFPAKPRVAPEMMPRLLEAFPGGYYEPTSEWGLDRYLEVVEGLQDKAASDLQGWMASARPAQNATKEASSVADRQGSEAGVR